MHNEVCIYWCLEDFIRLQNVRGSFIKIMFKVIKELKKQLYRPCSLTIIK